MRQVKHPALITALRTNADLVRQVAVKHGLSYQEEAVLESADLVTFNFGPLDDATTRKLIFDIPREAYYYKAVIGSGRPSPQEQDNAF
ncbi:MULTISPECIES: hypothetical protein [unclassified Roseateles]|uniref:hypothetical protein n=1 Tax=unclassified Roseateles TaxID=2626991 RepID=UPI0007163D47|nr:MULTISPECIES: hypothetical protein [unclassified Roseateles]KQW45301.1 hypothetical protein ASC81_10210 [Pelomonas sp. Root405]KRA72147.1 hypothetical protein ASD88_10215 [Pelomonas sp. Root662]